MKARYLSLHAFVSWQRAERPIDWPHRFGRHAPLKLEIGFGNGEFLVRQAQQDQACNYVGIELEWTSVQRGLRKIAQTNVANVRLIQADARLALERLFRPQSLAHVYALFPCPWPKQRHIKHRLFSQSFLQLLNSRLVDGGEVQIVTDHQPYVYWVLEQACGTGFDTHWLPASPRFSTKYERKWQAQGQERFYELSLRKHQGIALPLQEDITLQIHRVESFHPHHFQPANARGNIAITFKDFLFDPTCQRGMVRVFVSEDNFPQEFWIEIARGAEGWYIRPARGCAIVPTVGVQRALDLTRDAACH
jgi:tRNA (guanine-N7-)-methyltransferase